MSDEGYVYMERSPCKPSGFAEYDNLSGYVDRTYTTTWHDDKGNLWRKTCTVINLGRPDRGTPVDGNAQMSKEELSLGPVVRGDWIANKTEQHIATIKGMLATGPRMSQELADALGISGARLSHIIRDYGKRFGIEKVPGGKRGFRLVTP